MPGTTTAEATRMPRKMEAAKIKLDKNLEHPDYDVVIAPIKEPGIVGANPCDVEGMERDGFKRHSVYEADPSQMVMVRDKNVRLKRAEDQRRQNPPPPRGGIQSVSALRSGQLVESTKQMGVDSLPSEAELDADARRSAKIRENPAAGAMIDRMTEGTEGGTEVDLEELSG